MSGGEGSILRLAAAGDRGIEEAISAGLPTLFLGGIFVILALFALYFVRDLAAPVVLAFILNALLQPVMKLVDPYPVPRIITALALVLLLCGLLVAVVLPLSVPATGWFEKAPVAFHKLEDWVNALKVPLQQLAQVSAGVEKLTDNAAAPVLAVSVKGEGLGSILFSGTRLFLIGLFTTMLLLFYLLVSGDMFLRRMVEILPTFSDKKQLLEMSRDIQRSISRYLLTVSIMSLIVGVVTGMTAYLSGLADPLLWAAVAFALNYVPIIGPLFCASILFMAGLLTFDSAWTALIPAGVYLIVHLIESESVTPMLLARRFTLNPVLVIISIVFWYWMWGVIGACLAVPLLVSFKLICDRIGPFMALGHFLSGDAVD